MPALRGTLVVVHGAQLGNRFDIYRPPVIVGREPESGFSLDDGFISGNHFRIDVDAKGQLVVVDLGSSNGSALNGEPLVKDVPKPLRAGDRIQLAHTVILELLTGDVDAQLAARREQQLYHKAYTDSATKLPNHHFFLEKLDVVLAQAAKYGEVVTILVVDVDHLSFYNDVHGVAFGDDLLRLVAQRVAAEAPTDSVARREDDDELWVLLGGGTDASESARISERVLAQLRAASAGQELSQAQDLAERIRKAVHQPVSAANGGSILPSVSIGLVTTTEDPMSGRDLVRIAQQNMHKAKRAGRNLVFPRPRTARTSATMIGTARRAQVFPMALFGTELEKQPPAALFAVELLHRSRLLSRSNGPELVDELDAALDEAAVDVINEGDALGRLDEGGVRLVAVRKGSLSLAEETATRLEEYFERARARRGLPYARIISGQAVSGSWSWSLAERAVHELEARRARAQHGDYLPLPIALAARVTYAQTDPTQLTLKLVRLAETTIRWLLTLALAELRAAQLRVARPEARLAHRLANPTDIAGWLEYLGDCVRRIGTIPAADLRYGSLHELLDGPHEILQRFVGEHGRLFSHGAIDSERLAAELAASWRAEFEKLLQFMREFEAMVPVVVTNMDQLDEEDLQSGRAARGNYQYGVRRLVGDHLVVPETTLISSVPLARKRVYVITPDGSVALSLDPLVVWLESPKTLTHELFFLDRIVDGHATFKNPRTNEELERGSGSAIVRPEQLKSLLERL